MGPLWVINLRCEHKHVLSPGGLPDLVALPGYPRAIFGSVNDRRNRSRTPWGGILKNGHPRGILPVADFRADVRRVSCCPHAAGEPSEDVCFVAWVTQKDVNTAWIKRQSKRPSYSYDPGTQSFRASFPPSSRTGLPPSPDRCRVWGPNAECRRPRPLTWGLTVKRADSPAHHAPTRR